MLQLLNPSKNKSQLNRFLPLKMTKLVTDNTSLHTLVNSKRFKREEWVKWKLQETELINQLKLLILESLMMLLLMSQLLGMKSWIKQMISLRAMLRSRNPLYQFSHHSMSQQSQHLNNKWHKFINNKQLKHNFGLRLRSWRDSLLNRKQNLKQDQTHWYLILMKVRIKYRSSKKLIQRSLFPKQLLKSNRNKWKLSSSQLPKLSKLLLSQHLSKRLPQLNRIWSKSRRKSNQNSQRLKLKKNSKNNQKRSLRKHQNNKRRLLRNHQNNQNHNRFKSLSKSNLSKLMLQFLQSLRSQLLLKLLPNQKLLKLQHQQRLSQLLLQYRNLLMLQRFQNHRLLTLKRIKRMMSQHSLLMSQLHMS